MTRSTSIFGVVLILVGIGLLLQSIWFFPFYKFIGPLVFIGLGVWFIYRHTQKNKRPSERTFTYNNQSGVYTATYGSDIRQDQPGHAGHSDYHDHHEQASHADTSKQHFSQAEEATVLGSKPKYSRFIDNLYVNCNGMSLQNIEASVFIGDSEVNLSGGILSPGLNRVVVSGFIGDLLVLVPKDFPVYVHSSGFIGSNEVLGKRGSGFGNSMDSQTPDYDAATSKLYIAANNFIGDIRVYRV
jgi:hypothetical protein